MYIYKISLKKFGEIWFSGVDLEGANPMGVDLKIQTHLAMGEKVNYHTCTRKCAHDI